MRAHAHTRKTLRCLHVPHAHSNLKDLSLFNDEKNIFKHERKSGTYPTHAYFLAKSLAELPIGVFSTFTFCVTMYWLVGFQNTLDKFLLFLAVVVLDTVVAGSYTIAIGSCVPDQKVAQILCPIGLTLFLLFGGFFVTTTSIPSYWIW